MRYIYADLERFKRRAKRLKKFLDERGCARTLTQCQQIAARMAGYENYSDLRRLTLYEQYWASPPIERLQSLSRDAWLHVQARRLVRETGLDMATSRDVVQKLGLMGEMPRQNAS